MPNLRRLTLDNGDLDLVAAGQQCAIISHVYADNRAGIEGMLSGAPDEVIHHYQFNANTLSPNWVIVRQGTRFFITIAGTTNAQQWATHLAGAVGGDYRFGGVKVHLAMGLIADSMFDTMRAILPQDLSQIQLSISGHSMGGGCGFLIANRFVEIMHPDRVELLTVASPKVLTAGYAGPTPGRHIRLFNTDDPVPRQPLVSNTIIATNIGQLWQQYVSQTLVWTHYGRPYELFPDGYVTPSNLFESMSPGSVITNMGLYFAAHTQVEYGRRLERNLNQNRTNTQATAVAQQVGEATKQPAQPGTNINLNRPEYISPEQTARTYFGQFANQVNRNALPNSPFVTVATNEDNLRLTTNIRSLRELIMPAASGTWKFTYFINNSKYGHSESFYYLGSTDIKDAISKGGQLVRARTWILGSNSTSAALQKRLGTPRIEFLRVSDALNRNISQLIQLPDNAQHYGWGTDQSNTPSDTMSNALAIRLRGQNVVSPDFVSHSNHLFTGVPDAAISSGVWAPNTVVGPAIPANNNQAITHGKAMEWFLQHLMDPQNNLGFMSISATEPKLVINSFALGSGGVMTLGVDHLYDSGDRVRVSAVNARGVAGVYRIQRVDNATIRLAHTFPSNQPLPTIGEVQRIQHADGSRPYQFYRFVEPLAGLILPFGVKVSKKNLAREYLGLSFAHRSRRK